MVVVYPLADVVGAVVSHGIDVLVVHGSTISILTGSLINLLVYRQVALESKQVQRISQRSVEGNFQSVVIQSLAAQILFLALAGKEFVAVLDVVVQDKAIYRSGLLLHGNRPGIHKVMSGNRITVVPLGILTELEGVGQAVIADSGFLCQIRNRLIVLVQLVQTSSGHAQDVSGCHVRSGGGVHVRHISTQVNGNHIGIRGTGVIALLVSGVALGRSGAVGGIAGTGSRSRTTGSRNSHQASKQQSQKLFHFVFPPNEFW